MIFSRGFGITIWINEPQEFILYNKPNRKCGVGSRGSITLISDFGFCIKANIFIEFENFDFFFLLGGVQLTRLHKTKRCWTCLKYKNGRDIVVFFRYQAGGIYITSSIEMFQNAQGLNSVISAYDLATGFEPVEIISEETVKVFSPNFRDQEPKTKFLVLFFNLVKPNLDNPNEKILQ